jgi:general secretion pathway protein J
MVGFTLVEVLLALFLFSIIIGVVFASFAAVTKGVEQGRQSMDLYRVGRTALQRMAQEISAAVLFPNDPRTTMHGEDHTVDRQGHDRISFAVVPYRRFSDKIPGSDLCTVSYEVTENPEGKTALFREEDCTLNDEAEQARRSVKLELTDMAIGLDITYYDAKESHDTWPPSVGSDLAPLPCWIRIALTLRDAQQHERAFITTVSLPMRGTCEDEQARR